MISRDTTGAYYISEKENSFVSREEWFGAQIAFGYLGIWLNEHIGMNINNNPFIQKVNQ